MTFPMPALDDRTFQDFVDEAKRRIPYHTPEWTDHNLSDPGVALIELFAWMTESIIYRLNIVPDRLYRSFLELVGIRPFAPQPASTIMTFWLAATDDETRTVSTGTEVTTTQKADTGAVGFMTTADVVIRQPQFVAALTGRDGSEQFDDVTQLLELDSQRVECFSSMTPGDAIYFGFKESLAGNVVFADIRTSVHGIGVRPERPPLAWEVSVGRDLWEEAEIDEGGDTTFGLNADGRVLLYLPFRHTTERYGAHRAYWLRARLTDGEPTYKASPTIRTAEFSSIGGRAPAEQGEPVTREELGVSDGTAGQRFSVIRAPVLSRRDGETVEMTTKAGEVQLWQEVENFAISRKNDRHFTWDSATGEVQFGPAVMEADGTIVRHGAIPEKDARIAVTAYRCGGGAAGNVPADSIVVAKSSLAFVQRVNNRKPAKGGVDAETVENTKVRGPLALVTGDRAVTTKDFEYLTLATFDQIARARCRAVQTHEEPIRLYVVGDPQGVAPQDATLADFLPSEEILADVAQVLDEHRLIGALLHVSPPEFRAVSIAARVVADYSHQPRSVRERCLEALYDYVNPVTGGPEGKGWPWGAALDRTAISQLLRSLEGVHRVKEVLFFDAGYDPERDYTVATRSGIGAERVELAEFGLPVSALHAVLVDEGRPAGEGSQP